MIMVMVRGSSFCSYCLYAMSAIHTHRHHLNDKNSHDATNRVGLGGVVSA